MSICQYCGKETEPDFRWHEGSCAHNKNQSIHGHVYPRRDKTLCMCGGPSFCFICWEELQALPSGERVEWLKLHDWTQEKYLEQKIKFERMSNNFTGG